MDGPNPKDIEDKVLSSTEGFERPLKKIVKSTEVRKLIEAPLPSKSQDTTPQLANLCPFEETVTDPRATPMQLIDAVAGLNQAHIQNTAILAAFGASVMTQQMKGEFLRKEALHRIEESSQPVAGSSGVGGGD